MQQGYREYVVVLVVVLCKEYRPYTIFLLLSRTAAHNAVSTVQRYPLDCRAIQRRLNIVQSLVLPHIEKTSAQLFPFCLMIMI
jgi:hypothetical protein